MLYETELASANFPTFSQGTLFPGWRNSELNYTRLAHGVSKHGFDKTAVLCYTYLCTWIIYVKDHRMPQESDLRKGSVQVLILSLLQEQPMYGYQLSKELQRRSKGYFTFKEGTLYPALHRMEKEGLIRGQWQVVEEGPSRKYYHLTEKGRQELTRAQREWATFAAHVLAVLGKPGAE
ncbi:MAG: PadR family transcriptional regulator [Candidatus Hadarchaeum sp.]